MVVRAGTNIFRSFLGMFDDQGGGVRGVAFGVRRGGVRGVAFGVRRRR